MSLMQIHRNPEPTRLIRMGHAPEVIKPEPKASVITTCEECGNGRVCKCAVPRIPLHTSMYKEPVADPPPVPEPEKNKRGRPAKMSKDKDLSVPETSTDNESKEGE